MEREMIQAGIVYRNNLNKENQLSNQSQLTSMRELKDSEKKEDVGQGERLTGAKRGNQLGVSGSALGGGLSGLSNAFRPGGLGGMGNKGRGAPKALGGMYGPQPEFLPMQTVQPGPL